MNGYASSSIQSFHLSSNLTLVFNIDKLTNDVLGSHFPARLTTVVFYTCSDVDVDVICSVFLEEAMLTFHIYSIFNPPDVSSTCFSLSGPPLIFSPFVACNCCLQIVNLHELAIGPAKQIRSIVEYPVRIRGRKSALAVIAHHHHHPIPLRKRSNGVVATKTASGLRKGIWVSGDNRGHMEPPELATHMYRIIDDVSCFMFPGSIKRLKG